MKKIICAFLLISVTCAFYFYKNTISLREVTRFSGVVQLFGYKETNHISIINSCLDDFSTSPQCKIDVYYFTDLDKDQVISIANKQGSYTKATQTIKIQDLINIDANRKFLDLTFEEASATEYVFDYDEVNNTKYTIYFIPSDDKHIQFIQRSTGHSKNLIRIVMVSKRYHFSFMSKFQSDGDFC